MNRLLATLSAAAAFAGAATSQCFSAGSGTQVTAWTWTFTNDDGVSTNHIPLGFNFPVAGAAAASFSHVRIGSNGWLMLTDGVLAPGLPGNSNYGSTGALAGVAGDFPVLSPFWGDLYWGAAATNGVFVETNPGVSCKIAWLNVQDFASAATGAYSFTAEVFSSGEVRYGYNTAANNKTTQGFTNYVGVSRRNGVAVPAASDFVPGPAVAAGGMMFQGFLLNAFDGQDKTLSFTPAGLGWLEVVACSVQAASHTSYGSGCYTISDSAFQLFGSATSAGPALTGNSVRFAPAGTSYLMTYGGGTFIPPSLLAVNVFAVATDDGEAIVTPSAPLSTPQGPQASLRVHSNGLVSWGPGVQTFPGTNNYSPTANGFLNAANPGIWWWHDYNEGEVGSGRIVREEVVIGGETILVITWNDVENYASPEIVNRSTVQAQLNLTTSVVTIVFSSVDANPSSIYGSAHLVGYSPAGASINGGSINLATALPLLVSTTNLAAMALSAAPAPVSTPGSGTLVTYTQSNIPEAVPTSGIYVGATVISLGQDLPGTGLGGIGMPGCTLHIVSLDLLISFVGATNSLTTQFQVPAGVPYGFQLFAQSVALIAPNSLPNGQNAFGATLSNAIASFISSF